MTRPIRAFFIQKEGNGWSVNVCRDFEAVLEAWTSRPDPNQAAVLHIGFDRPPSAGFEEVVHRHPGRVLLSASAKYGMPRGYGASAQPVAYVDGLPLHVGTHGWGYVIEDLDLSAPPPLELSEPETSTDWVATFLWTRPDLKAAFQSAGVIDDETYLKFEALLPWDARFRSGQFRFRSLIGDAVADPCAFARAAPPWMAVRSFSTIPLPTRPSNLIINLDIKTVADLGRYQAAELLRVPTFGLKSLAEIADALGQALDEGPVDIDARIALAGTENLRVEIQRTLSALDARERDILSRRMGFGRPAETLQSIADDYGVTRERVRQIEAKVVKRTIREAYWDDLLTGKLEAILTGREFPLPLLGIEALDPWFEGISEQPETVRYILANFCGDHIGIVTIDSVDYFGFLHQSEWEAALSEAQRVLDFSASKQWTEDHCKALIAPLVKEASREFRSLLWQKASPLCHFSDGPGGQRVLVSYGRGAEQLVEAILADAHHPLHYSEIARLATANYGRTLEVRRAHAAAAAVGVLVGRGTFALPDHLGVSNDQASQVVDEAEDLVMGGPPARQWHASEILAALVEQDAAPDGLDKYILDFLLRKSGRLRRLGRMAWSQAVETAPTDRIAVREVVIAILEEAGRPLSANDIRQRLVAVRGVNGAVQLHPADPLIRLDTSLWGLNDRDLPLKRDAQLDFISKLVDQLTADERGIHISEIHWLLAGLPSGFSPLMAFSLAAFDPRIAVSIGQHLYLKEWGEPRRETVAEALMATMDGALQPLPLEVIEQHVSERVGRPVDRAKLSATLQGSGYDFDHESRGWSASKAPIDEDEEIDHLAQELTAAG